MSWLDQVWHVAVKDLRQSAWAVVLVLLTLTMATALSLGAAVAPPDAWTAPRPFASLVFFGSPLLYLAGGLLAALLVQADAPARSDADWVHRPLTPSAVFSAKLVTASAVLLLLPLGAQALALWAHGVAASSMLPFLARAALLHAGLLSVVVAVASVTGDLRSYLLSLILGFVGWATIQSALAAGLQGAGSLPPTEDGLPGPAGWIVVGLGVTLAQYLTRNTRRTVALVFPLLLLATIAAQQMGWTGASSPMVPEGIRAGPLRMSVVSLRPNPTPSTGWLLQVEVEAPEAPSGYLYTMYPMLSVELPDGTKTRLRGMSGQLRLSGNAFPASIRWLDESEPSANRFDKVLSAAVPPPVMEGVARGGARLVLEGSVVVTSVKRLESLPLRPGAKIRHEGTSIEIVSVEVRDGGGPYVLTTVRGVALQRDLPSLSPWEMTEMALVDPAGSEGIHLMTRDGTGGGSRPLVLAGVSAHHRTQGLMPRSARMQSGDGVPGWWPEATLLAVEWKPEGGYPAPETSVALRVASKVVQVRGGEPLP